MYFFETQYGGHTVLSGHVSVIPDSFSHAFGRERVQDLEIKDFEIRTWLGDWDLEMTVFIRETHPALYAHLKSYFLESFLASGV